MGVILRVRIFRVGFIQGENFPRWEFSMWKLSGGNHPVGTLLGGSFPSTTDNCFNENLDPN